MEAAWACGRATVHDVHRGLAAAQRARGEEELTRRTIATVQRELPEDFTAPAMGRLIDLG